MLPRRDVVSDMILLNTTSSGVLWLFQSLRWDRAHAREGNVEYPNVPIAADPAPGFGLSSPSQLFAEPGRHPLVLPHVTSALESCSGPSN